MLARAMGLSIRHFNSVDFGFASRFKLLTKGTKTRFDV